MEILWTKHAREKMRFYRLSESRLKRVLRNHKRKELGIASGTIAVMQPTTSKHTSEIWLMYQTTKSKVKSQKLKVISAWRYPGKSPIRGPIPIPLEILEELGEEN
jgi:ribosomal protein L44E